MAVAPQPAVVEDHRLLVRPDRPPPLAVALDRREDVQGERVHLVGRGHRRSLHGGDQHVKSITLADPLMIYYHVHIPSC